MTTGAPRAKVSDLVEQLKRELDVAQADNDTLVRKNEQLKRDIDDAESRERLAEEKALEAERKRQALEAITATVYKDVVSELFEEPSRSAKIETIRWAAVSILVSILATLWASLYSARVSSQSAEQLSGAIDRQLARRIEQNHSQITSDLRATEQHVRDIVIGAVASKERHAITLRNQCSQSIWVAIRYLSADNIWTTRGWYFVQSRSSIDLKTTMFGDMVFFFAKSSSGLRWPSGALENQPSVNVAIDQAAAFTVDNPGARLEHPEVVTFFGRSAGNDRHVAQSFYCGQ